MGPVDRVQGDGERAVQRGEGARYAALSHAPVVMVRRGDLLHLWRLPARVRPSTPGLALAISHHNVQRVAFLLGLLLRLRCVGAHPQEGFIQIPGMFQA